MSMMMKLPVQCPFCGASNQFTGYQSVTVNLDASLRSKVKDKSIFQHSCRACSRDITVVHDLLYHDADAQKLVWFIDSGDPGGMEAELDKFSLRFPKSYQKRLVYTLDELTEKIVIYEHNLNDLYVHMLKLGMTMDNDIATETLRFNGVSAEKNAEQKIHFYQTTNGKYASITGAANPEETSSLFDSLDSELDWIHVNDENLMLLIEKYPSIFQ